MHENHQSEKDSKPRRASTQIWGKLGNATHFTAIVKQEFSQEGDFLKIHKIVHSS